MSVNKELWLPAIEENFYSQWETLTTLAKDDSVFVMAQGTVRKVYIPNAGSPGAVVVNNTSYPVDAVERTDSAIDYNIDSFQVPPVRVGKYDAALLSYDKVSSVVADFMGGIGEHVMFNSFVKWYPGKVAGRYVETTGDASLATASDAPGSTTAVLGLTEVDVKKAAKMLDLQKVPDTGRILLLPPKMFYELHDSVIDKFDIVDNDGLAMFDKPFYGFKVVKMHQVINTTSTGTVRAYGHAGATTDLQAGLAYQKDCVSVAREGVYVYDGADRPEYFGDILSAETWAGASYRRTNAVGVIAILQDAV
jgi:hypothetical protein